MRLFTAINFDEDMKDSIMEVSDKLRLQTLGGGFALRQNLHLTLNFIGETKRFKEVTEVMEQAVRKIEPGSFTLEAGGFGRFQRREGDICFVRVEKELTLCKLQKELMVRLTEAGFEVENLEYKPHLTLARRVKLAGGFDDKLFGETIPKMSMEVERISLMKSERIMGKLTYTEVFGIDLG